MRQLNIGIFLMLSATALFLSACSGPVGSPAKNSDADAAIGYSASPNISDTEKELRLLSRMLLAGDIQKAELFERSGALLARLEGEIKEAHAADRARAFKDSASVCISMLFVDSSVSGRCKEIYRSAMEATRATGDVAFVVNASSMLPYIDDDESLRWMFGLALLSHDTMSRWVIASASKMVEESREKNSHRAELTIEFLQRLCVHARLSEETRPYCQEELDKLTVSQVR